MSNLWKVSLQQATQGGMTTALGLLKSWNLTETETYERSERPIQKFLGKWCEKFDLVSLTRQFFSTETRNPLGTRKHLVADRGDLISILKKRHGLSNSSLESMKQNWNCQLYQDHSWIGWMIRCEKDKTISNVEEMEKNFLWFVECLWL